MTQQAPPAMSPSSALPDFERPPVGETILGVQFAPLPRFKTAHLGVFWKTLGSEWSHLIEVPWLPPMAEMPNRTIDLSQVKVKLTQVPPIRLQIRTGDQSRMIQAQNGRFHYNWLRPDGQSVYPRYPAVRAEFDAAFAKFTDFVRAEGLGEIAPNYWEVTYINHIPQGTLWKGAQDWADILNGTPGVRVASGGLTLESMEIDWNFLIPDQRGRLQVQAQHGQVTTFDPDGKSPFPLNTELMVLTLTANGPIAVGKSSAGVKELGDGLDLGRETIVRAFRDLTSDKAHAEWGLKQ